MILNHHEHGLPPRLSALCALVVSAFVFQGISSHAQPRLSDTGSTRQDFRGISAQFADGSPIDPLKIAAAYMYEMNYDSTKILYTATEFRQNNAPLILRDWSYLTAHDEWDIARLNDSSGTVPFVIHAGDTLSLYREFEWYDRRTGAHRADNYSAADTLSYSIALYDAATGARLALIDSLGIMRRDLPGYPSIHGDHPLYSLIRYVVPQSMNGKQAEIRFGVDAKGSGNYYFIRRNIRSVHLSDNLSDSNCLKCNWNYNANNFHRRSPGDLRGAEGKERTMRVEPNPTSGEVRIHLSSIEPGASLGIYDAAGNLLFMPELSIASTTSTITYRFTSSGQYYIALQRGGALITTQSVTVVR